MKKKILKYHLLFCFIRLFRYDCLLVVDTVASLGGTPFFMDKWKVDVVYTGSQKVLGASPGLAPISFNSRAITKVMNRHKKVAVYYWDIMLLSEYWNCFGKPRMYIIFHLFIFAFYLKLLIEILSLVLLIFNTVIIIPSRQHCCMAYVKLWPLYAKRDYNKRLLVMKKHRTN